MISTRASNDFFNKLKFVNIFPTIERYLSIFSVLEEDLSFQTTKLTYCFDDRFDTRLRGKLFLKFWYKFVFFENDN